MKLLVSFHLLAFFLVFADFSEAVNNRRTLQQHGEQSRQAIPHQLDQANSLYQHEMAYDPHHTHYGYQQHQVQEPYYHGEPSAVHAIPQMPHWRGRRARSHRIEVLEEQEHDALHPNYDDNNSENSGIEFQAPTSPPAPIHSPNRRHGKGIDTSQLDEHPSDSEEEQDQLSDLEQKLKLNTRIHADDRKGGYSEPSGSHLPLSNGQRLERNRAALQQEWERYGLGAHMDPKQLADQVALINLPQVSNIAKGQMASRIVSGYHENDPLYLNNFKLRSNRLTKQIAKVKAKMIHLGEDNGKQPDELHNLAVREAIVRLDREKVEKEKDMTTTGIKRRAEAAERMDKVGARILHQLAQMDLDISQMTLGQLDQVVRQMHIEGPPTKKKTFTDYYFRWLSKRLNFSNQDIDLLRENRGILG